MFVFTRITMKCNKCQFMFCIHSYLNEIEYGTNINLYFSFFRIIMKLNTEQMSVYLLHWFTLQWNSIWYKYQYTFYIHSYHNEMEYRTNINYILPSFFSQHRIWNTHQSIFWIHSYNNEMLYRTHVNAYFVFPRVTMELNMDQMFIHNLYSLVS